MGKYLIDSFNVYHAKMAARERKIRRKRMPHNDEITISGVTWRIPRLLKHIADTMSEREGCNPVPTPPHEPAPPTRFSIHWTIVGRGEWHGFLVGHWESLLTTEKKSHEYNTPILRISIDSSGCFVGKLILAPKNVLGSYQTFSECKRFMESYALSSLRELHILCIKEDYNKVKVNWWE
jgi:hypothetical protein